MSNSTNNQYPRFKDNPWEGQVSLPQLFQEMRQAVNRFIILEDYEIIAVVLWIIHTYFIKKPKEPQLFDFSPILQITSPEPECGKSTLFDILEKLVNNPFISMGASDASIFRRIEMYQPTMMFDEFDNFDVATRTTLLGILNSGFKQNGSVSRMAMGKGKNWDEFQDFSTWCPKVVCGIGNIPANLQSRCITIKLRRKLPSERVESMNAVLRMNPDYFFNIRRKIVWFVMNYEGELLNMTYEVPSDLSDRLQNLWEGLFKIADFIDCDSGDILLPAIEAAKSMIRSGRVDAPSLRIELLKDIKHFLTDHPDEFIESLKLRTYLIGLNDRPWVELQGRHITPHKIAELLKPFGMEPIQKRFQNQTVRGYDKLSLESAITRYL
jgi:putative DNA primase/helicase